MITLHADSGPIGTVALADGKLTGSTPGIQHVAEHMTRKHGTPQKAFRAMATMNNGYIWAQAPVRVPATVQHLAVTWDDVAAVIELANRPNQAVTALE